MEIFQDRLFFACLYSYTVWDKLASRLIGPWINPDWNDNLRVLQGRQFTRVDQVLVHLLFQTTVYHIWRERNARRHSKAPQPVEQMIKLTDNSNKKQDLIS